MFGCTPQVIWICLVVLHSTSAQGYGYESKETSSSQAAKAPGTDLEAEGNSMNDPGMDGTSKACRYDEGKGWSDCDPFELIRFKVLRLVHGGSQCEDIKNITKHCTPHDFPYGTHWLIQEHRKCISELNRLKAMIGDLSKFIDKMNVKGKELFDVYMKLKATFEDLTIRVEKMKNEGVGLDDALVKLKDELQSWKNRARDLQKELEELKMKFHDLETEEHQLTLTNDQLTVEINIINKENEAIQKEIERIMNMNEELKRRITESEHTKEKLEDLKIEKQELHSQLEKLTDKLQDLKDKLAELKIQLLAKKLKPDDAYDNKDTHVDMSLEMFIVHNKSNVYQPEPEAIYYTTEGYIEEKVEEQPKCLISYYGTTNETCWYETEGEKSEDYFTDAIGHHLVEAHWKYFTIDVKDQYECDKASQLHYEFLLNRCSPKHFLPVLSAFKESKDSKELATNIFPAPKQQDGKKACWITFLGAHGHCEKHKDKYKLYNTPDLEDLNAHSSKEACLSRQDWWQVYCDTPVIMTYVPAHLSTNWAEEWIMHDSHGGRMFEDADEAKNQINPDSLNPEAVKPGQYTSDIKSEEPFSPDYHDSPEYRKSLHLEGQEKEAILKSLRSKLGLAGPVDKMDPSVQIHPGIPVEEDQGDENAEEAYQYGKKETPAPQAYKPSGYGIKETQPPYGEAAYQQETTAKQEYGYQSPTEAPYKPAEYQAATEAQYKPAEYKPKTEATYKPAEYKPETEAPYKPEEYEPATDAPYKPAEYQPETEAPYKPAEYQPPTKTPYKPAEYQPETEAPYKPAEYQPETEAPYKPAEYHPETEAPYKPEEYQPATEAPYKPAEYQPPQTTSGYQGSGYEPQPDQTEYFGLADAADAESGGYAPENEGYGQGFDPYSY